MTIARGSVPHALALFCLGAVTLSAAHHAVAQELAAEQVLRIAVATDDIRTVDPHFSIGTGEFPVTKSVYEALTLFPDGHMDMSNLQPGLATEWSVAEDNLTWTFKLREGVHWHHGHGEFTGEDVVFSINRIKDEEVGSPFRRNLDMIDEVRAIDDYTVEIVTAHPVGDLPGILADYQAGYIVSKSAVESGIDMRTEAIGTGPFMVDEYIPREGFNLVRNPDYWRGEPIIERIEMRFMPENSPRELALRSGEVHAIEIPADQDWVNRLRAEGLEVELTTPANHFKLLYNLNHSPIDDIRVRKALSHAVNRDELIQFMGEDVATPEYSPLAAGYVGHTRDVARYDYDPDRARELLAEAGFADGLNLSVVVSNSNIYLPPMQVIQEQWRRAGINMDLRVVDHPTFHQLIREDVNPVIIYGAFRMPLTGTVYLTQFYHSDSIVGKDTAVINFTHYGDILEGVDRYIDEARFEIDVNRQIELWEAAQRQIMEDVVVTPLFVRNYGLARVPRLDLGHEQRSYSFYSFSHETRLLAE